MALSNISSRGLLTPDATGRADVAFDLDIGSVVVDEGMGTGTPVMFEEDADVAEDNDDKDDARRMLELDPPCCWK
jgi:hypothetical protein